MSVTPEHLALASAFQLAIHQRQRTGQDGAVLGRGAGSSTDYLDHRRYVLGDDIRRLDWKAYARTDQLLITRYQEEIRPIVEIWYDDSASMGISSGKAQLTVDTVGFLAQICRQDGLDFRVIRLSEGIISTDELFGETVSFSAKSSLEEMLFHRMHHLRKDAHVFLISDFLSAHTPSTVMTALFQKAATVTAIQILAVEDQVFQEEQSVVLEDSETGELVTLDLDRKAISAYLESLKYLQEDWTRGLRARGGIFCIFSCTTDFSSKIQQLVETGSIVFASQ